MRKKYVDTVLLVVTNEVLRKLVYMNHLLVEQNKLRGSYEIRTGVNNILDITYWNTAHEMKQIVEYLCKVNIDVNKTYEIRDLETHLQMKRRRHKRQIKDARFKKIEKKRNI